MNKILLTISLLASLLAGNILQAQSLSAVTLNKEGAALLTQQNFLMAQDRFLRALATDPFHPALHLNLGISFEGQNQIDKAEASYQSALKLAENSYQVRFMALFNLGQLQQKAKKVDEALFYYQQALDLKPDSQETKVNIEMLIQQGEGGGEGKNDKDDKKDQDQKDQKGQGDKEREEKDKKDQDGKGDKEKEKPQGYKKERPQPKQFKSTELTPGDVNKILGEIKQQEQKIRQDYNRKDVKERPRGKDW